MAYRDGVVDVEVVTQDTWTLKPEVSFGRQGGQNRSSFGIEERNLFGTGAQLGLGYRSDVRTVTRRSSFTTIRIWPPAIGACVGSTH